MSEQSLGDRMKDNYEKRTRTMLPRRTNTIIRLDGKAFHTFTKGFTRPYDSRLMDIMDHTAYALCQQIQGAKMAYVQSDEISILLTDYDNIKTEAWFNGNVQKITSISAAIATAEFNRYLAEIAPFQVGPNPALFDSRVFTIADPQEVVNYFIWRQQDWTRNSIQMLGQAHFSHKQLHGVNCNEMQEKLIREKDVNWNDYSIAIRRGRAVKSICDLTETDRRQLVLDLEPPIFTQDRDYILKHMEPGE